MIVAKTENDLFEKLSDWCLLQIVEQSFFCLKNMTENVVRIFNSVVAMKIQLNWVRVQF